jgi:hypothetical protein
MYQLDSSGVIKHSLQQSMFDAFGLYRRLPASPPDDPETDPFWRKISTLPNARATGQGVGTQRKTGQTPKTSTSDPTFSCRRNAFAAASAPLGDRWRAGIQNADLPCCSSFPSPESPAVTATRDWPPSPVDSATREAAMVG